MKKIISIFAAVTVMLSSSAFAASAETTSADDAATYCFDSDVSLAQWEAYGSTAETGFSLSIDTSIKESGDGSLCVSENIAEDIDADSRFGGTYVSAGTLGLESFKGCTIEMSVYLDEDAAAAGGSFTMFSDGIVWLTSAVTSENAGKWVTLSLTVPENADNTRIGFTIPVFSQYNGKAAYVDNLTVYSSDGTAIANVGDQKISSGSIVVSLSTGARIALLIVLVVIIAAVVGGIGFVVSSFIKRFT